MEDFKEPILPPEGDGSGWRFESADLNLDELREYLGSTAFDDEGEIIELLTRRYHMSRRESIGGIEAGMTRVWNLGEFIDAVDPKGNRLSRDIEKMRQYQRKIMDALHAKKGHVLLDGWGIFLKGEVMEKLNEAIRGDPYSGHDPRAVVRSTIRTLDGKTLDLRVFEVFNRNQKYRYEYILQPVEELERTG